MRDDGVEQTRLFKLAAQLGEHRIEFEVPAQQFAGMNWVSEKLGAQAVVFAGFGTWHQHRDPTVLW